MDIQINLYFAQLSRFYLKTPKYLSQAHPNKKKVVYNVDHFHPSLGKYRVQDPTQPLKSILDFHGFNGYT